MKSVMTIRSKTENTIGTYSSENSANVSGIVRTQVISDGVIGSIGNGPRQPI